jgi:hypothetical protein
MGQEVMKVMVVKSTEREMNGENQPLVADGPAEFEKQPVEVQGFRKITHHLRGIQGMYLKLIQKSEGCQHVTSSTWKH